MRTRRNGEGSIYFVPGPGRGRHRKDRQSPWVTGTWVAAVTLPDGKRRTAKAGTRAEAAERLVAIQAKLAAGLPAGDTDKVAAFMKWWLGIVATRAASGERSVNTVDNATWAVEKWIVPYLGTKRLRDLEPEHVETMLGEMAMAGLGRESVKRVRSYLGQALDVAQRRGKVGRNVARLAEMPTTRPSLKRQALTHNDARKVLVASVGDRLEALFVMAMMLGMRPGELTGLLWEWVDLPAGTLQVARSLKRERGKLRIGDVKTDGSDRPLTMPVPVLTALKAHRRRQLEERMAVGPSWADTGLVFTNEVGGPIDPSNLRRATKRFCLRAGVDPVSPNEMGRHTAATLLYDAGVPLERIADMLGHESTRMLEKHYRHKGKQAVSAHVAPMEALFQDPSR